MPSDDAAPPAPARLLGLTAQIVAAHASYTPVTTDQLPELIRAVHRALSSLGQDAAEPAQGEPAVPIWRSVQHDRITCLECGARMAMLKRHLRIVHGLTPDAYRERWNLGRDYPMIAPDYAEMRSGLAKRIGLGQWRAKRAEVPEAPAPARGRGRRRARDSDAR